MIPGNHFYPQVYVASAGVAVTGLVTANFTVLGTVGTTTSAPTFTVTETDSVNWPGYYRLDITSIGTAGFQSYLIKSGTRSVAGGVIAGWVCAQDLDTLYAIVVRPVAVQSSVNTLAGELPLSIVANRYTPFSVAVTAQDGSVYDLSGFNNIRFTVWDKNHVNTVYSLSGVTGSALGILAWNVPENASFFSYMDAAITAGNDSLTFYYDVIGDAAATTSKTETIIRGQLTMYRYEGTA